MMHSLYTTLHLVSSSYNLWLSSIMCLSSCLPLFTFNQSQQMTVTLKMVLLQVCSC